MEQKVCLYLQILKVEIDRGLFENCSELFVHEDYLIN